MGTTIDNRIVAEFKPAFPGGNLLVGGSGRRTPPEAVRQRAPRTEGKEAGIERKGEARYPPAVNKVARVQPTRAPFLTILRLEPIVVHPPKGVDERRRVGRERDIKLYTIETNPGPRRGWRGRNKTDEKKERRRGAELEGTRGKYGMNTPTNEAGKDLINWCQENVMAYLNSFSAHHRRRGTWFNFPRGTGYELDGFIMTKEQRHRHMRGMKVLEKKGYQITSPSNYGSL